MEIVKKESGNEGAFVALEQEQKMGEMTYSISNGRWIIDHTGVEPKYRGQSVGEKLLEALVQEARNKKIEVLPLCPFAAAMFQKKEAWRDVLKK